MLKIFFKPLDTEAWKRWCQECEEATEDIIAEYETSQTATINSRLYKALKKEVYFNDEGVFRGKCAYCEQKISGDQHGDIEHFRPKKRVTDENNNLVQIESEGETKPHPGYYWLAYDWRNLLPSCQICNQPSSTLRDEPIGKRNRFPISGPRAIRPGEEAEEEPLLINPTVDDPNEHLRLEAHSGVLAPITDKGAMSIEILGLNERGLPGRRAAAYEQTKARLTVLILDMLRGIDVATQLQSIARILKGHEEFSLAGQSAIAEIDARLDGIINRKVLEHDG